MKNNELTNSKFGKWGWSMIIYTFLLYYFSTGLVTDGMNLYPDAFQALYGMDRNTLLGFATPAGILGVVGGIVFGRVCVKTGARKLSGWTLIITGILYAVFGFCGTPVMYLIVLAAMSFVSTAYGLICTAELMGNWFPRKKGIALGWATMGAPFCSATFVAILSILYNKMGLPMGSLAVGVAVIVLGIATFFWVHDYPEQVGAYPDNIKDSGDQMSSQEVLKNYKSPFTIGKLLRDKDMWLIAIGFGALWMVTAGIMSQFVPRMTSVGLGDQAMLLLMISALVGLIGSYVWGWLDQKAGTKAASCVYALCYIVALVLMIFAEVVVFNYIAIIFVGFGIGGLLNLMPSLVISVYGRYDFTVANSLVCSVAALIQKAAFVLMAVLLKVSGGSFTLPYAVFIVIDVIGLIMLLFVTKKCKGKQD